MERGKGIGKHRHTERPAAHKAGRKKGNTPGCQRGGRANKKTAPEKPGAAESEPNVGSQCRAIRMRCC